MYNSVVQVYEKSKDISLICPWERKIFIKKFLELVNFNELNFRFLA